METKTTEAIYENARASIKLHWSIPEERWVRVDDIIIRLKELEREYPCVFDVSVKRIIKQFIQELKGDK